jgi:hypothetical protein
VPKVFLSYARDDYPVAKRICDALSYIPNISVWFDERNLYVGDAFRDLIRQEIETSDYCVAILSKAYAPDRFQHWELQEALRQHQARSGKPGRQPFLLPIFLEDVAIPIPGFETLHRIRYENDGKSVIRSLRSRIKHSFQDRETSESKLRCQSHIAWFRGLPRDAYFLKVANVSNDPFTITHVWIEVLDEEWFFEYPNSRPIPTPVIHCGEEWETYFYCDSLPGYPQESYLEKFRIRLSNGQVYRSYKNDNVAGYGKIAGGPLAPREAPAIVKLSL